MMRKTWDTVQKSDFTPLVLIVVFVILGVLTRTIWQIAPNVEFVTAFSLAAGFFLRRKRLSLLVPLGIMLISDRFLGMNKIALFTWSAFLFGSLLGIVLANEKVRGFRGRTECKIENSWLRIFLVAEAGALLSTTVFYIWTNLGVWVLFDMYPQNLEGLLKCYYLALPFLRNQVVGNAIFVPLVFLCTEFVLRKGIFRGLFRTRC